MIIIFTDITKATNITYVTDMTNITNKLPVSPSQFHSTIKGHTASTSVVSSLADPKHCQAGKTFKEQNCPDYYKAF